LVVGEHAAVMAMIPRSPKDPESRRWLALGNNFGLAEAIIGLLVGWVLSSVAVALFSKASGQHVLVTTFGSNVVNLIGLWVGLVGAALYAARYRSPANSGGLWRRMQDDFGLGLRPVDIPIGILVGVVSQYALTPLLELPLLPFVPHLFTRINQPAKSLTHGVNTPGLVVLGLLVCIGSPFVEELYFRGLLLRGLVGRFARFGPGLGVALGVVATGVIFGLVHFEPLELIALAGFGMVLSIVALRTGRLGAGMIAHATFNAVTFITIAVGH